MNFNWRYNYRSCIGKDDIAKINVMSICPPPSVTKVLAADGGFIVM